MPSTLYESAANGKNGTGTGPGFQASIAPGIVTNNIDALAQGRVLVRVPAIDDEVWARLVAAGAGDNRGFLFIPQIDDEVLVAFNQRDPHDAYLLGGLWNLSQNRMPESNIAEALVKRKIRTGVVGGLGHELEFDDATQTITIKTSTDQQITINPLKIELSNTAGTLKITMDNASQSISIEAALSIELKSVQKISLESAQIELKGAKIDINSLGPCTVQGLPIKLN